MDLNQLATELKKAGHTAIISANSILVTTPSKTQRLGLTLAGLNIRFTTRLYEQRTKEGTKITINV